MSPLEMVFLGHQSWWVHHADVSVLIDPILGPTLGHHTRLPVHPPRTIDVAALGPIDLVVLTHEHNDHIELASLALLDRSVPVLVAPLMPAVVVRAVQRLGFSVHRAVPEVGLTAGGLHIQLLPGGRRAPVGEGRVAQVLLTAETEGGAVTVLIGVDTMVSSHTLAAVRAGELPAPDVVVVANNTQIPPSGVRGSARALCAPESPPGFVGLDLVRELCVDYLSGLSGSPAVVLCGGGFVDTHELGVPYCFDDHPRLAALARALGPGRVVYGPVPGTLLRMEASPGGAHITEHTHPSVTLLTEAARALRQRPAPTGALPLRSVLPFASPDRVPELLRQVEVRLSALVPALLAHPLGDAVVGCHRHAGAWLGPRRLLVHLIAHADGSGVWWALDLAESRFVPVEPARPDHILADWPFGFEVCLQDLHALLEGDLVVWDVLGVALRHWSVEEPGVAAFLCAVLGEAVRPDATARVLASQLSALGVPTSPTDLLAGAPGGK